MRMKGLGYRYDVRMRDLLRFDRFLQRHPGLAAASLPEQLKAWGHEARGVRHQLQVQQCGLVLSKALHRKDTTTRVLSIDVGLQRRVVQQQRRPYISSRRRRSSGCSMLRESSLRTTHRCDPSCCTR